MTEARASESLLRARGSHEHSRVTFVELFFDLVFVFAVTQLSHTLLEHLDAGGVLHTILLFLAVWWVWIYTSWATNWLDPAKAPVRLMLFALMLAGLVLSTSIPNALEGKGLAFAGAYVCMQVGRCLFTMWALRGHSPSNYRNFQRITCWFALSAVFWIAGALAEGEWRVALWLLALAIEYVSPPLRFWTPGLGASTTQDWDVAGEHMAERCGLFIILSLGESILVTGATFGKLPWTPVTMGAFATAFVGSVAMWWIYFNIGAERARRNISSSSDPGRVARLSYTYLHIPLVAGIIVAAVGDELLLAHPEETAGFKSAAVLLGGPALYLTGNLIFKRATANSRGLSHMIGLSLLALLSAAAASVSLLTLGAAATLVLVVVAVWETRSLRQHTPGAE
jgi:low temperature requirement protein LtrA